MQVRATRWSPSSWRDRPALQLPAYLDHGALHDVEQTLARSAPVVDFAECQALRHATSTLAAGWGFLLQGGDCAEGFDDQVAERVATLSTLFDAMAARLAPALRGSPLIEVARIAGQFAKPRTSDDEWREGVVLPAYRGDIVNGAPFDCESRRPDPHRMLRAHMQSVGTAACLAAMRGGSAPIYTSHEALLLPYEEALTRQDASGRWWATSGHMLWLGDRTRHRDGAHVEYLRGIENVIGVKCGPSLDAEELLRLCAVLDGTNRPGKLVLIGRFGAREISSKLPPLLRATRDEGLNVIWASDPMHGNTTLAGNRKIRRMKDILSELDQFAALARAENVHPAGVHLEMSALDVTECIGGRGPLSLEELESNWQTACDPRLNRAQAVDLADHLARQLVPARALSA